MTKSQTSAVQIFISRGIFAPTESGESDKRKWPVQRLLSAKPWLLGLNNQLIEHSSLSRWTTSRLCVCLWQV